jgi:hypothetical protein
MYVCTSHKILFLLCSRSFVFKVPKLLEGDFDPNKLHLQGCGAPIPIFRREGLAFHATYTLPYVLHTRTITKKRIVLFLLSRFPILCFVDRYKDSPDKSNFPIYNAWTIYRILRSIDSEDQELLGFNWEHSPIRALMTQCVGIPPPIIRKRKEESYNEPPQSVINDSIFKKDDAGGMEKKKASHAINDDNTQELKDVQSKIKKFLTRLVEHQICTQEELGAHQQLNRWKLPDGTIVECQCTNPVVCECVLLETKSDKYDSAVQLGISKKLQLEQMDEKKKQSLPSSMRSSASTLNSSSSKKKALNKLKRNRTADQEIEDALKDMHVAITTWSIGDISRKGAGRHDLVEKSSSSSSKKEEKEEKIDSNNKKDVIDESRMKQNSWQQGASSQNAAQRKEKAQSQSFVGKKGIIRQNVWGKRCNFTARTVAAGNERLEVYQVGISREIQEQLTIREKLQPFNRVFLMDLLRSNKIELVHDDTIGEM